MNSKVVRIPSNNYKSIILNEIEFKTVSNKIEFKRNRNQKETLTFWDANAFFDPIKENFRVNRIQKKIFKKNVLIFCYRYELKEMI